MNCKNLFKILVLLVILAVTAGSVSAGFLYGNQDLGDALLTSGEYKVGEDLPAGEYFVKCHGYNLYFEVSSDGSGDPDSVIYNFNTGKGFYVTLEDGEYIKIDGGDLYELNKTPKNGPVNGTYGDGMYKVGVDIPAGQYDMESSSNLGYFEITNSSRHIDSDIITNGTFTNETNKTITLEDGQYLRLHHGTQIRYSIGFYFFDV